MTHKRKDPSIFDSFYRVLEPMVAADKLGCVLAQFPYSFKFNRQNLDYLGMFREKLGELPVVIEFRNAQWLNDEVFDRLRQLNLGFCCVDEPQLPNLLPAVAETTSSVSYLRFHGRNSAKWWQHEHAYERYDYTYTPEELDEWLPRIRKLDSMSERTFIFANNHWRAQSVNTIRQLRMMLD